MISLNITANKEFITGTADGVAYSVTYSPEKLSELQALSDTAEAAATPGEYKQVVAAFLEATKEDLHAMQLSKIPSVYFNKSTRQYHLKAGELILEDAMPQVLVDRLLYSLEVGVSVEPLIKFYTRLLRNPNYSVEKAELLCWYVDQTYTDKVYMQELVEKEGLHPDIARERATNYQTPITLEGQFACYKYGKLVDYKYILDENGQKQRVSRFAQTKTIDENTGEVTVSVDKPEFAEDYLFLPPIQGESGDAFYCGDQLGHFIRVGQVHTLPDWSMVDTNDNHSCVPGLHAGNKLYCENYGGYDRKLLEVLVDPALVGAIVKGRDGAIRVKEYFVNGIREEGFVLKARYHSSDYAKRTDAQWEQDRAEAIAAIQQKAAEKAAKADAKVGRLNSL